MVHNGSGNQVTMTTTYARNRKLEMVRYYQVLGAYLARYLEYGGKTGGKTEMDLDHEIVPCDKSNRALSSFFKNHIFSRISYTLY